MYGEIGKANCVFEDGISKTDVLGVDHKCIY